MTVVLVHGNPESDAIWDELRAHLGHWWMCEDPGRGAEALRQFFDSLGQATG